MTTHDTLIFDFDKLMDFLLEFQPHFFKYLGKQEANSKQRKIIEQIVKKEREEPFFCLNADMLYDTYKIAEKVYCDEEKANRYSDIYSIIVEKFLTSFVGIPEIADMYKPAYFGFEWMMHIEYKPKEQRFSDYRDHYIHQVRNLFEMFCMLDQWGYFDKCMDLYEKGNSFLCRYMRKAVSLACGQSDIRQMIDSLSGGKGTEEEYRRYVYRYIIYSGAIVTSLVHDIGYPMQYINRNLQWIGDFLPTSGYFFEKKTEWQKVTSMLENSLLYRMYPASEIAERMEEGNHGAISACVLLIKFYESGLIHSLRPEERMVIEISSLAIYEHTLQYKKQDHKKAKIYQNVFQENPFSYLFRFCDDLQEWERVYFDVTKQSDFLVCRKCGTVSAKGSGRTNPGSGSKDNGYYCCCGSGDGINANIFQYRHLAHIDTCKTVELSCFDGADDDQKVCVKLDYGLLELLQASAYNPRFAQKRARGLKELKQMVYNENGLEWMYVQAFITNNPIAIKTEIMRRYLRKKEYDFKTNAGLDRDGMNEILSVWKKTLHRPANIGNISNMLKTHVDFYVYMAEKAENIYRDPTTDKKDMGEYRKEARALSGEIYRKFNVDDLTIRKLIVDCFFQAFLYVEAKDYFTTPKLLKERYFEMGYRSDDIVNTVRAYIAGDLYDRVRHLCRARGTKQYMYKGLYDYYSDYYFFECLHNAL